MKKNAEDRMFSAFFFLFERTGEKEKTGYFRSHRSLGAYASLMPSFRLLAFGILQPVEWKFQHKKTAPL
jgi:hypothetical protein